MRYTIRVKCLVPFNNDKYSFTQHIDPPKLGHVVRNLVKKLVNCNIWITDEHGRECATIKRKAIGFGLFRLREVTMNGNLVHM